MKTLLAFILFCTMMSPKLLLVTEQMVQIKTYSVAEAKEDKVVAAVEEAEPEPAMHYYGNCRITFYCPGSCCCGAYATGITASGVPVQANRTVANGSLPFGTRVMIDGQEYVVEDRGVGGDQFDIFVWSHQEALARGLYYTDVYVIDG